MALWLACAMCLKLAPKNVIEKPGNDRVWSLSRSHCSAWAQAWMITAFFLVWPDGCAFVEAWSSLAPFASSNQGTATRMWIKSLGPWPCGLFAMPGTSKLLENLPMPSTNFALRPTGHMRKSAQWLWWISTEIGAMAFCNFDVCPEQPVLFLQQASSAHSFWYQ